MLGFPDGLVFRLNKGIVLGLEEGAANGELATMTIFGCLSELWMA
jgi:hypothetical protein